MLPKDEPVLSNADVKNFEKFQDIFNCSTGMVSVEKAINKNNHELNETIDSLLLSLKASYRHLGLQVCAKCVERYQGLDTR